MPSNAFVTSSTITRNYLHRFVGWLTNFIHNRHLASENLVRGYNTSCILASMPDEVTAGIRARLEDTPGYTATAAKRLFRMPYLRRERGQPNYVFRMFAISYVQHSIPKSHVVYQILTVVYQWYTIGKQLVY
jgi:hypothetical protein